MSSILGESTTDLNNSTNRRHMTATPRMISSDSLDAIIDLAYIATDLDRDHLPARVQLGLLYYAKGELALAEEWLERACTHTKHRGAGGGHSSMLGGATSSWGWRSWRSLADVLKDSDRLTEARKAVFFGLELRNFSTLRGYECLPRFKII